MDYEVFNEWKRHFISVEKPMPRILNGHSNHTLPLAATEISREHELSCCRCLARALIECSI
jgi:hypothetical protein